MIQASGTARSAGGAASIEGRGVIKTFPTRGGTFTAVDNLTLNIARGEFVSLIGPSGCGKSTFLLMAAGLQPLSKGEILVNGSVLDKPLTDVGIVFQDHLLLEFRTALANVMLQAEIRGLPLEPARRRALELFERLGIAHATDRYPKQLSGGMRQRVAIARALITTPPC
jgi:NitT/TauT family transport system ATP-binding protein